MKRTLRYLLLSSSLLTLAACGGTGGNTQKPTTNDAAAPNLQSSAKAPQLMAFTWQIDQIQQQNQTQTPTSPFTLNFYNRNSLSVQGLCNTLNAGYQVQDANIIFHSGIATLMACDNAQLMQLEQQVGKRLNGPATWNITNLSEPLGNAQPQLHLHFENGERWALTGQATPETKYGSQGEILFLEIQAERTACHHPLIKDAQCLLAREVHYDSNSVRTTVGDWTPLYTTIQGYEHNANIQTVLRVKRYPIANPPADAPNEALVLDMIVSQELR